MEVIRTISVVDSHHLAMRVNPAAWGNRQQTTEFFAEVHHLPAVFAGFGVDEIARICDIPLVEVTSANLGRVEDMS